MIQSQNTRERILAHYNQYPLLQIRDIFKFLFQSAFGCEHLVSSLPAVTDYIAKEYKKCANICRGDIDALDGEYSRVHLSHLDRGLSQQTLAKIFFFSAKAEPDGKSALAKKLKIARELIKEGLLPFSEAEFDQALSEWQALGFPAIHHSDAFRQNYAPAYRVISNKYVPFLPLFERIDSMTGDKPMIVAIDGGSASGKSTLGEVLSSIYSCTVLHMDDFFLRPEQRTPERFAEIGGNIDRERFLEEVLLPLSEHKPIDYRRFDCSAMKVAEPIRITPEKLVIIEGAYSMHTAFSDHYDLSVFLDIQNDLQRERIQKRNSPEMAKRFFNQWIPLEEKYFSNMHVSERCDIKIHIVK